jgi:cation:H+ antiporter
VAALRLGQTNMAVANLLGSNMANMCFVPLMHAVSMKASFYADVDAPSIMVLTYVAILMTAILMLGLMVRSKRSFLILGWEAVAMLAVYLAGAFLVLRMGLGVGG